MSKLILTQQNIKIIKEPMNGKILIYHPGALGDVILTFPALLALRKLLGGRSFTGLGNYCTFRLAQHLGIIDEVLDQEDRSLSGFFNGPEFPPALNNLYAALLWLRDTDDLTDRLRPHTAGPIISLPPVSTGNQPLSLNYLQKIRKSFPIDIPQDINDLLPDCQNTPERILIHPGSGSQNKVFPLEFYLNLEKLIGQYYNQKIYYLLGPAELESGLEKQLPGKPVLCPASTVKLANLLKKTALYIGNDSGPSHLAGFLQIPSIVLYKSTDPAIWGTLGKHSIHISAKTTGEAYQKTSTYLESLF